MSDAQVPPAAAADEAESTSTPESYVLHVLCPSLPQPNRFTLSNLPPSTTVADLKTRLSRTVPSHPPPDTQRLFCLGKPLLNDSATLPTIFEPVNGSEFSIHLVLPPPASSEATGPGRSSVTNHAPSHRTPPFADRSPSSQPHRHGLRYPGRFINDREAVLAMQEEVEAIRRDLEFRARTSEFRWRDLVATEIPDRVPGPRAQSGSASASASDSPALAHLRAFFSPTLLNNVNYTPHEVITQVSFMGDQVRLAEEQLLRGIPPPIDEVNQLRTQIFDLLAHQNRTPRRERHPGVEILLGQIFRLSARADQLRRLQDQLRRLNQSSNPPASAGSPGSASGERVYVEAPVYLVSSPYGYQAVVVPPDASNAIQTTVTDQTRGATASRNGDQQQIAQQDTQQNAQQNAQPNAEPNANAAVMENVVRQAVLNQQPVENVQVALARFLRQGWLFVRLYLFCYVFGEPGTWTRILYLGLALLITILSETSVPQRLYQMVLAPVQRHLEGLVQFTPEEQVQPQAPVTGSEAAMNPRAGRRRRRDPHWTVSLHQNLRRVERFLALLIASLVPGVGERHIEVRNAAEAARNAELARQEEEERRRLEEAAAAEENAAEEDNATSGAESSAQATAD